jgi:hypothetical protein
MRRHASKIVPWKTQAFMLTRACGPNAAAVAASGFSTISERNPSGDSRMRAYCATRAAGMLPSRTSASASNPASPSASSARRAASTGTG